MEQHPSAAKRHDKVRENRLRRMAERYGMVFRKSRRRDPRALDYGMYWLVDLDTNGLVFGGQWGATLDDIEAWLLDDDPQEDSRT